MGIPTRSLRRDDPPLFWKLVIVVGCCLAVAALCAYVLYQQGRAL